VRSLGLGDVAERAQRLFARMNEAFQVLGNDEQRREYAKLVESGLVNEDDAETEAKMLRIMEAEEAFQLGELAMRRNHWSQAREDFRKAVELNPDEGEHHALWGWAEWNYAAASQRPTLAAETRRRFRAAVALSPRNPSIYYYRGRLADELGELDAARWCYRKVLRLDPNHEGAQRALRQLDEAAAAPAQAVVAQAEPPAPAAT
jgi:Flp pilus assembly protein TadD